MRVSGMVLRREVQLLAETGEGPYPQHTHRANAPIHPAGDLLVGKPLDVAQQDDLGIVGGQACQGIGEAQLQLVPGGMLAG